MEHEAIVRNQQSRRQLIALVDQLTDAALLVKVHDDWTVAAKLAHVAFWDRFALAVLNRWAAGESSRIDVLPWYDDILNDSVLAESLALAPRVAASLAVEAITAMDARLTSLGRSESDRLAADAERAETDTNWLLHRYRHRELHLDEVDATLRG